MLLHNIFRYRCQVQHKNVLHQKRDSIVMTGDKTTVHTVYRIVFLINDSDLLRTIKAP